MHLKLLILTIILALGFARKAESQSQYHFSALTIEQGLSSPFVWSICQDKYGFLWIGTTNGLNRYDGHNIRKYFNNPADSFSIPGNTVFWIHKDSDGELWFACGFKGVVKYDYAKDRFEKFMPYKQLKKKIGRTAPVWRVGEDQKKRIYVACGAACFRFDKTTKKIEDLTPLFEGKIETAGVAMFIHDKTDRLWILTDNGLFLHTLSSNSMEYIPYEDQKFGYGNPAMIDAEFINDEEMIITTPRSGFVFFNTRTRKFRPPPPPINPEVSKVYSTCGGVIKDRNGRIWVANSVYGLMEYLPNGELVSIKNEPSFPYPHPEQEGQAMTVYEDRDGNVWYGTSQQGVIWFQPAMNFISVYKRDYGDRSSLASDAVYGFLPSGSGSMLVATSRGLSELDLSTRKFINYLPSIASTEKFPVATLRAFGKGEGDSIYMATDAGLSIYNSRNKTFQRYTRKAEDTTNSSQLFNDLLAFVFPIKPDELILISFDDGRAARFQPSTGKSFTAKNTSIKDTLYGFKYITSAALDKKANCLWLEAAEGELYCYDYNLRTAIRHRYTSDTAIKTIVAMQVDNDGDVWLCTRQGLIKYNPKNQQSRIYALPTATQDLTAVGFDSKRNVWVTTQNELVKINHADGKITAINLNAKMPYVNFYRRSLYIDNEDKIWLGSNKGFCVVKSKGFDWQMNTNAPHLVNFRVFDQPKVFNQPYYELNSVKLNYNENFFSFDFSALDFHQSAGLQYAYKLEPFDKDWNVGEQNSASYTNVPPGKYRLLLRTQYGLGKWNEAQPIEVIINPPWWQTWWAIMLFTLAFAFCIYLAVSFRRKRKAEKRVDETINYFANSLYGENSVSEICWDIARNCITQLRFEDCIVYLKDVERDVLIQKAAYGPKNPKGHEIANPMEIPMGKGIVGNVALLGKPILIGDTTKDSRYIVDDEPRLSELSVPILHDGKVIGVIDSEHSRKNFFTQQQLKAVITIASISSNKIAEAIAEAKAVEKEIQLLEIKKLLAESKLMSLRAQMNPHFVFNCLNSIQECIVTEKYGEASNYLNKFSKLFRTVLSNSGRNLVSLNEEKQVLELYLSLEHMRFEGSFTYKVTVDEALDMEELMIPSMLLQPYVENALWHGLMHKIQDRYLSLHFKYVSEEIYQCIIDDNGIGRKRSEEIKAEQSKAKRHQSMGMQISKDRIELLQRQEQHATLKIIDKYSNNGYASGTTVIIELSTFLT